MSPLGDIGLTILATAAVKAGAAHWTLLAIVVGAIGTGAGFATRSKPILLITFAILLIGLAGASASLVARPVRLVHHDPAMVPAS